jgi:hypothetical protein
VFTQMFQQYVPKCSICFNLLLQQVFLCYKMQVCLFQCYIYFHTYDASVLTGCCVCLQWFQVFFRCFCRCFGCMFYLFSDICCNCCFWMFQTRSSVASLFSPFFYLASVSGVGSGGSPHWYGRAPHACWQV